MFLVEQIIALCVNCQNTYMSSNMEWDCSVSLLNICSVNAHGKQKNSPKFFLTLPKFTLLLKFVNTQGLIVFV